MIYDLYQDRTGISNMKSYCNNLYTKRPFNKKFNIIKDYNKLIISYIIYYSNNIIYIMSENRTRTYITRS